VQTVACLFRRAHARRAVFRTCENLRSLVVVAVRVQVGSALDRLTGAPAQRNIQSKGERHGKSQHNYQCNGSVPAMLRVTAALLPKLRARFAFWYAYLPHSGQE